MKKLSTLLTLTALLIGLSGMAQTKKPKTKDTVFDSGIIKNPIWHIGFAFDTLVTKPYQIKFENQRTPDIIMSVDDPKRNKKGNIDSIIIHVHKSQLHWINDSTLTIKPKK